MELKQQPTDCALPGAKKMRNSFFAFAFTVVAATLCSESFAGSKNYSSNTLTYNGSTYSLSSTSTCADGTAALRMNRKWWCKVPTTTTTSTTTTGSTSTTTPTTPTTTPAAPVVYSAQLSWTAPTTRADGTPLTSAELAGYEIYYTTDDPAVAGTISVASSTAANYTLSNLAAGNYYFAMSAIDTTGLKSALSAMAPVKFGP